jgi:hypothetical protein
MESGYLLASGVPLEIDNRLASVLPMKISDPW